MNDTPWNRSMGNMNIDLVKVGARRRDDMGDIEALAASIDQVGLLHPIVIDIFDNLIAGQRRLEACKRLGWEAIPYRIVRDVDEQRLREIELRENLDRKDFTELELSKNMAALVEVVKERLRNEFRAETIQTQAENYCPVPGQKLPIGRPAGTGKPGSVRDVASEIGVPRQTVHDAVAHIEAVKKYPILQAVSKTAAIQIARNAKDKPPFERQRYVTEQAEMARKTERGFQKIDDQYKVAKEFDMAISASRSLEVTPDRVDMWIDSFPSVLHQRDELLSFHRDIMNAISNLQHLAALINERLKLRVLRKGNDHED